MTSLWKTRLMLMFHSTLLSKSEKQIISIQNTWKSKMHSVQSRPQGTREWQICRQQKHLHQYWNSQNRDSLRVPDATGSTDERGQRPALDNRSLSAINFATYSGPRHRDYSFGPNPKVAHWLMGNQYGRGRILRSAVGREETRTVVMSEIGRETLVGGEMKMR